MYGKRPGFTLIECLAAMAVVAIVCSIALPALADAAARTRDAAVRSAMVETMQRAATHAVATATRVVLCPSSDGSSCLNGTDWSRGWIAFADLDQDRDRSERDTLVHAQPALEGGSRLRSTAGRTRIVVQPRGDTAGSNATFTICSRGNTNRATAMILANSGRWRFAKPRPDAASACAYGG